MFVWQFGEWNVILAQLDWTGPNQPVKTEDMNEFTIDLIFSFEKKERKKKTSQIFVSS